jgi:hypothetical protein
VRHVDASRDPSPRAAQPTAPDPRHDRQLSELRTIAAERSRLDERERAAIDTAREFGLTWAQIATALGMHHRQGAQQRQQRLRKDSDPAPQVINQGSLPGAVQRGDRGEDPERAAKRAVDVARWARSELVGLNPHKPRAGFPQDLDTATLAMRRCLADLQNRGYIADQGNRDEDGKERPAWQHHLPAGWEAHALSCASRLRGIADHAIDLARMHAQAVSDHNAARQARVARHTSLARPDDNLCSGACQNPRPRH